jgi:hypothetical protein
MTTTGIVVEMGNGLPDPGDLVPGNDGNLYKIVSIIGPIHTGGRGNYVHATFEAADWDDTSSDDDVFPACASLDEDEDEDEDE